MTSGPIASVTCEVRVHVPAPRWYVPASLMGAGIGRSAARELDWERTGAVTTRPKTSAKARSASDGAALHGRERTFMGTSRADRTPTVALYEEPAPASLDQEFM